jgi:hypothetical protein
MRKANFCVLVTMNAANMGIDKSSIDLQMRFNWLRDLLTYFQEQGRGLQQKGSKLIFFLNGDLSLNVSLVSQLVSGADGTVEASATSECNEFNTAVSP